MLLWSVLLIVNTVEIIGLGFGYRILLLILIFAFIGFSEFFKIISEVISPSIILGPRPMIFVVYREL
jgi:hypothetical protein